MVELIWDSKYDSNGKRTPPPRLKLPFQTVETINESAQQRQMSLDMFSAGRPSEWRNRLIWGDKKYVLPALLDEFAGKVDLIYLDPPFNVGADFSFTADIPDHPETEEAEGITTGCGTNLYCPESPVTRAQMAVLLVRTFNLP
jgi:adenine-specific DNA-methyltransferase